MTSELETNLVAVERIEEYCQTPTEVNFIKTQAVNKALMFIRKIREFLTNQRNEKSKNEAVVNHILVLFLIGWEKNACIFNQSESLGNQGQSSRAYH